MIIIVKKYQSCVCIYCIQWNPSCEVNPLSSEMWLFKRDGLSPGIKTTRDGLSSLWPLKRGSTICISVIAKMLK